MIFPCKPKRRRTVLSIQQRQRALAHTLLAVHRLLAAQIQETGTIDEVDEGANWLLLEDAQRLHNRVWRGGPMPEALFQSVLAHLEERSKLLSARIIARLPLLAFAVEVA